MAESCLAFLIALVSALLPFINIEVYLLGMATLVGEGWLLAAAVAAGAGQTLGKVAYYFMGRGVLTVPWLRRRAETPGRWSARAARWRERAQGRPVWTAGLLAVSSLVSVPPFMVVSVLAGTVRMPLPVFLAVTMATRTARFALLVYAPGAALALL
ncbi:hypothetical protein NI17_000370 [Thermobifida halotolerans]|uniref:Uncharacterized protein n=1 Tax=Thermobifida halotolerans TaxID=483545 RepID=A0A399G5E4_9ACTN|nr:hypothetical protein [Thermobifida halotolerans]UOE19765.1 hypothetical protein NI17_000370 [Thermobifida halotolerans]